MHHEPPPSTLPPAPSVCGRCGKAIPADGVPGLCPRCELTLALEGPADESFEPPVRGDLGGYEMIEEAGRGGMGSVWKARQPGLGRLVAIKILPGGDWAGASVRLRFQREAEAAARLRHPHLVAVHDCGEHEGTLWYSMDFIEGESLGERIHREPPAPHDAAVLMEKVARAVAYAHQQGVWHRDLKPANILLDKAGEPHVTDFGLARTEASSGLTVSGSVAGSPHYLPPERAADGTGAAPDAAGDIYAVGATLYHALTGHPPFTGTNISSILAKVISDPPARPTSLVPHLPRDLETICLKCLEKTPERRYATAEAVADDLKRFLEGLPVRARPVSAPVRTWRWAKRRPALAALTTALTLAVAGLFVLQAISVQRSNKEARRLKVTADAAAKAERAAQIESGIASARSARLSETFTRRSEGLESISQAAPLAIDAHSETALRALRDEAAAMLALPVTGFDRQVPPHPVAHDKYWWIERTRQWTMMRGPAPRGWHLAKFDGSSDTDIPITGSSFSTTCSRDGHYVYTKRGDDLTGEGSYWLVPLSGPATLLRRARGRVLDWSPDSTRALRADSKGYVVDDLATGRVVCRYDCLTLFLCGRFSNNGRWVAVTGAVARPGEGNTPFTAVFQTETGEELWQRDAYGEVAALAWNDEDTFIAFVDSLGKIQLLSQDGGLTSRIMQDPGGAASEHSILNLPALEFTRDGFLVSMSIRHIVSLWDLSSGRMLAAQVASGFQSGGRLNGQAFGPLRSRRMEASWLGVRPGLWTSVAMPCVGEDPLSQLTWSPDGRRLAAAHNRGTRLWDVETKRLQPAINAPLAGELCTSLEFFPQSSPLLACYPGGLWQQLPPGGNGASIAFPVQQQSGIRAQMARAANAPLIAAAVGYATAPDHFIFEVQLYTPDRSAPIRKLPLHAPATCVALSPDGTLVAIGVSDPNRSFAVFKTDGFGIHRDWQQTGGAPHTIQFDPSGRTFIAAIHNIHLFDTASGKEIGTYSSASEGDGIFGAPTAAFDPSGRFFAVTEPPRRITLYRSAPSSPAALHGWENFLTLESPSGLGITRLSFSPDGRQLAAASTRPSFELWDLGALKSELNRLGLW